MMNKLVNAYREARDVLGFGLYLLWMALCVLGVIWLPLSLIVGLILLFVGKIASGLSVLGSAAALALFLWGVLIYSDKPRKRKP